MRGAAEALLDGSTARPLTIEPKKGGVNMTTTNTLLGFGLALVFLVSACATPDVVSVQKMGDDDLNCQQIKEQFAEAQDFEKKARREKGATGTNVAAAVFFWPALLATYSNIEEAVNAARDRQDRLQKLATKKGCKI